MHIKGIIFDMDGTMVDNMMIHHRAWQRKLAALGLELTLEDVRKRIHGVNLEILEGLFGDRFTLAERIKISAEKEAAYREIFLPQLKLIDGLHPFLENAFALKIPMGIGTAAPEENANFILNNLTLRPFFRSVIHAGNVEKGKPNPEVFEKVAAQIQVPISECLIFEDSPTGVAAAERANCKCIVITTSHEPAEFTRFSNVLAFVKDFKNLGLIQQTDGWEIDKNKT